MAKRGMAAAQRFLRLCLYTQYPYIGVLLTVGSYTKSVEFLYLDHKLSKVTKDIWFWETSDQANSAF